MTFTPKSMDEDGARMIRAPPFLRFFAEPGAVPALVSAPPPCLRNVTHLER
jgi:hypothetical protein